VEVTDRCLRRDRVAGRAGISGRIDDDGFKRHLALAGTSANLLRGGVRGQLPTAWDIGTQRQLVGSEAGSLDVFQINLATDST
jgi:hypothetical protein